MYQIIIKKTVDKRKVIGKSWEKVSVTDGKTEYGYAPETETVQTETAEIYSQVVEELDLVAVINAVNKGGG